MVKNVSIRESHSGKLWSNDHRSTVLFCLQTKDNYCRQSSFKKSKLENQYSSYSCKSSKKSV